MPLPTPTQLRTMDYAFQGQPFVSIPAKTGMTLQSMDYSFQAQPFVPNPDAAAPPLGLVVRKVFRVPKRQTIFAVEKKLEFMIPKKITSFKVPKKPEIKVFKKPKGVKL